MPDFCAHAVGGKSADRQKKQCGDEAGGLPVHDVRGECVGHGGAGSDRRRVLRARIAVWLTKSNENRVIARRAARRQSEFASARAMQRLSSPD
jgi:hypothetical protein